MSAPGGPGPDQPAGAESAGAADDPHAGGAAPGEPHLAPRPESPLGGPLGPLFGADTLRDAVEDTFRLRIGAYVNAVAATRPHLVNPTLAMFHDWVNQPGIAPARPGNEPRYVIQAPGVLGQPRRKGDGTYAATYVVRLQLWLYGGSWRDVEDRLAAYLAAARTCLLQNGSLGGIAKTTTWRGETVNPIAATETRGNHTWGQATLELAVMVDPVVNAYAGPAPLDPDAVLVLPPPIVGTGVTVVPTDPATPFPWP